MRRRLRRFRRRACGVGCGALLLTPCSFLAGRAAAAEVKPVVNAQLMGGQYFYNNDDSSFGGYASLIASPYLKFNERWSLVPIYSGQYQGTQQVQDLIGGGTLFQDSQNHLLSVKGIRDFQNGWKMKAIGSYGIEWLRETKDEDWTKGLYDSRRASGGVETEWKSENENIIRLAYDFYAIRFPNYQSLESGQADNGLGRELAQPNVLNNTNHALTLSAEWQLPGSGRLDMGLSQTFRGFADQNLVAASGDLTSETRRDSAQNLSAETTWPVWKGERSQWIGGLGYRFVRLDSNQNSYDASRTRFLDDFYSYHTHGVTTRWTWLGTETRWSLSFTGSLARQQYAERPTQDGTGAYGADKTHVDTASLSATYSYPIAKNFQLIGNVSMGWSDSNNTYTGVYQYHYHTASYLAGIAYAF